MHFLSKVLFKLDSVRLYNILYVLCGRIHDNSQLAVLGCNLDL